MVFRNPSLADRVRSVVLQYIRESRWGKSNNALPSENEIAEQLQVSRTTVREALSMLERERIIIRQHGSGTYINPSLKGLQPSLNALLSPREIIELNQMSSAIAFRRFEPSTVDDETAEKLSVKPNSPIIQVKTLYLANEIPAILLEGVIPIFNQDISFHASTNDSSMEQIIFRATNFWPTYSLTTIQSNAADIYQSQVLEITEGTPLTTLVDLQMADNGKHLFFSQSFIAPGLIKLNLVRNKLVTPERISIW